VLVKLKFVPPLRGELSTLRSAQPEDTKTPGRASPRAPNCYADPRHVDCWKAIDKQHRQSRVGYHLAVSAEAATKHCEPKTTRPGLLGSGTLERRFVTMALGPA
jgi:hypothetical protein